MLEHRLVDHLTIQRDRSQILLHALAVGAHDTARPLDILRRRSEHVVGRAQLIGVDAELAQEPDLAHAPQLVRKAVGVSDVGPGRIERSNASGMRSVDRAAAGEFKLGAALRATHADADRIILTADADTDQPLGCMANLIRVRDRMRVLDPRGDLHLSIRQTAGPLEQRQVIVDPLDIAGAFDLRDAHTVQPGLHQRVELLLDQAGVVSVGAHEHLTAALGKVRQDASQQRPCARLVVPRDGVFEVEAEHIGRRVAGLLDEALADARHRQHRSHHDRSHYASSSCDGSGRAKMPRSRARSDVSTVAQPRNPNSAACSACSGSS